MLTVPDRLLGMIELYAVDREDEKRLRREMRALKCEKEDETFARCYTARPGTLPDEHDCGPCAKRREIWATFRYVQSENRYRLRKIERLALRLSMPDPVEPEEPKPLLDMIDEAGR